jgi:hypothetical protein
LPGSEAFLRISDARVSRCFGAEEDVLEGHHAGVREGSDGSFWNDAALGTSVGTLSEKVEQLWRTSEPVIDER